MLADIASRRSLAEWFNAPDLVPVARFSLDLRPAVEPTERCYSAAMRPRPKDDVLPTQCSMMSSKTDPIDVYYFGEASTANAAAQARNPRKQRSSSGIAEEATEFGMSF